VYQRIAPYYPEANGKAEAAVKIVKREAIKPLCTAKPDWNPGQLHQGLPQFQTYYNHHRLHGGIGWQTPAQRWFTMGAETPKGMDNLFFFMQPDLHVELC
jgi:transposase InsO family protein